jgi:hypothetical protein
MGEGKEVDKSTKGIKKGKKAVIGEDVTRNCLHVRKLHRMHI